MGSFSTTDDNTDVVFIDWSPSALLDECEGDCDDDSDCVSGLTCYHDDVPPGCTGIAVAGADYCYDDSTTTTQAPGINCTSHDECPGHLPFCYSGLCDYCDECHYCHDGIDNTCGPCGSGFPTRENASCTAGPTTTDGSTDVVLIDWSPTALLNKCEGDCDSDTDCVSGLACFHDDVPPGCTGTAVTNADYCYDPSAGATTDAPSAVPTEEPTMEPTTEPVGIATTDDTTEVNFIDWSPSAPLDECEGDCDDDSDCASGLTCYHDDVPPGCTGTAVSGADYCYDDSTTTTMPTTTDDDSFVTTDDNTDVVFIDWDPSALLDECEGDCDDDSDCVSGLTCYHDDVPPGCTGTAVPNADYCYDDGVAIVVELILMCCHAVVRG